MKSFLNIKILAAFLLFLFAVTGTSYAQESKERSRVLGFY